MPLSSSLTKTVDRAETRASRFGLFLALLFSRSLWAQGAGAATLARAFLTQPLFIYAIPTLKFLCARLGVPYHKLRPYVNFVALVGQGLGTATIARIAPALGLHHSTPFTTLLVFGGSPGLFWGLLLGPQPPRWLLASCIAAEIAAFPRVLNARHLCGGALGNLPLYLACILPWIVGCAFPYHFNLRYQSRVKYSLFKSMYAGDSIYMPKCRKINGGNLAIKLHGIQADDVSDADRSAVIAVARQRLAAAGFPHARVIVGVQEGCVLVSIAAYDDAQLQAGNDAAGYSTPRAENFEAELQQDILHVLSSAVAKRVTATVRCTVAEGPAKLLSLDDPASTTDTAAAAAADRGTVRLELSIPSESSAAATRGGLEPKCWSSLQRGSLHISDAVWAADGTGVAFDVHLPRESPDLPLLLTAAVDRPAADMRAGAQPMSLTLVRHLVLPPGLLSELQHACRGDEMSSFLSDLEAVLLTGDGPDQELSRSILDDMRRWAVTRRLPCTLAAVNAALVKLQLLRDPGQMRDWTLAFADPALEQQFRNYTFASRRSMQRLSALLHGCLLASTFYSNLVSPLVSAVYCLLVYPPLLVCVLSNNPAVSSWALSVHLVVGKSFVVPHLLWTRYQTVPVTAAAGLEGIERTIIGVACYNLLAMARFYRAPFLINMTYYAAHYGQGAMFYWMINYWPIESEAVRGTLMMMRSLFSPAYIGALTASAALAYYWEAKERRSFLTAQLKKKV